jgi:Zn-dependent protease
MLSVQVTAGALIFLAVLLLILPLQWVLAVLLAAILHELCHAVAVLLCGGRINRVTISGRGAVMEAMPLSAGKDIICALAGPLGSFLLLLLAKWMPRTAICGAVHGLYNLIPLFPLDGGRILRGLIHGIFSPPVAERVFLWSQRAFALLVTLGCLMLSFRVGVVAVIALVLVFWRRLRENTLAKKAVWRYNRERTKKEVRL